jgi:hypothetical protein
VGRAPLDEEAIRLIEQSNPGVEFDWTRILKGHEAAPDPRPPVHQERRSRPRPREYPPRDAGPVAPVIVAVPRPEAPTEPPAALASIEAPAPVTPELRAADEPGVPTAVGPVSARLGSEGLSRLRARHAEVLARITEKITNPVQSEQLKASAERLNPDTWVTDAEVVAGLEAYETVFDSLRGVIGRRRKRRRRRSGGSEQSPAAAPSGDDNNAPPGPDDEGSAEPDEPAGDL